MEFGEPKVLVSSQEFDFTLPDFRYMTYFKVFYKASPSARSALFLFKYRDNFLVCCTDEDLVPRWKKRESKTIDAPSIRSAEVDDAGNVYIGYSEKQTGYLKYSTNGTSGDHPVTLPEGSASIILFLATRDTVFAAGTYGNSDYSKGVYKGIINKKGELASLQSAPFPNTFLEPLDKEGWASTKAKKFGIVNLFSGELQLSGDGALVMLAEFSKETGTPGAGYMHVGSVMHICFGKPAVSFARAPKYSVGGGLMGYTEHSIGSDYHFYYAFTTPSETVIIYGDNPDNLSHDIDLDAKVWTPNKEIYVAARIDKNGNVRREKVVPQPIPYHQTVGPAMITLPVFIDRLDQLVILQK
jgi:hypothetical protein